MTYPQFKFIAEIYQQNAFIAVHVYNESIFGLLSTKAIIAWFGLFYRETNSKLYLHRQRHYYEVNITLTKTCNYIVNLAVMLSGIYA